MRDRVILFGAGDFFTGDFFTGDFFTGDFFTGDFFTADFPRLQKKQHYIENVTNKNHQILGSSNEYIL